MIIVVVALIAQWARQDRRAAARSDRHADSSYADDELDAYNAMLRELAAPGAEHFRQPARTAVDQSRLPKLRSRKLFDTTKNDENAIAAPATSGLSNPAAAIGMAATL